MAKVTKIEVAKLERLRRDFRENFPRLARWFFGAVPPPKLGGKR